MTRRMLTIRDHSAETCCMCYLLLRILKVNPDRLSTQDTFSIRTRSCIQSPVCHKTLYLIIIVQMPDTHCKEKEKGEMCFKIMNKKTR
ncbi:CLUMA_CG008870, isoform A [Clunio marinus]|uniref:CLUMA_CG008870, isoform A n=1 Tax=Clunio marinus TaxID=568069 RepID=A0A1J1I4Y7_9DIPT|nr:CLUMA_CG008870, isoform A [Clunio marinus]